MILRKRFLLLIFMFVSTFGESQSFEDLVQQAYDSNLELKMLKSEYLAALEKAPQVGQRPDPEIGLGVFPLPVETRLGPQLLRLSASQMLPWFGVLDSKQEVELAKAKAVYEKVAIQQLEIRYQLKEAYLQWYELGERQKILNRNLEILEGLSQLSLAKVESGKTSTADVLRIQLKTEALQQEMDILNTAKAGPLATINQLLNRELTTPIPTSENLSFAELPSDRQQLADSMINHPMLRMFSIQQGVSVKALDLNKLAAKPSFGVGMDYIMVNKRDDVMSLSANGRDILQVKASIKIPLQKDQYEAKEREEQLKIRALEEKKENLISQFNSFIDKAYTKHEVAQQRINLYEKQKEITEATINILEGNYSTNGSNFDELLTLELEMIEYDLKILKSIIESHQAKNTIERYVSLY